MKKVLFIVNIPSPYRVDFFSKLSEKVNLTVWFENEKVDYREWKSSVENKGFQYKFFNFRENKYLKNLLNLIKEFRREKYDLYVVGGYSSKIGIMSILYLKLTGKKFILNADGGFIKKDSKKNYILKKIFISSANYWLSSGSNCTKYLNYYGAKNDHIYEYPFASVDYTEDDLVELEFKERKYIKNNHGLNDVVILSVGSFINIKGLDILIKSFENIKSKYKNLSISLLLIGGGELKDKYISYIKEKNLSDIIMIDFMDKKELIKYYKISDIFVFPSKGDVWGLVVNEAMSFGLPIIGSSMAGASHDLMKDGRNGFIFESENIDDLTSKLELLVKNKQLRKEFGRQSKNIIEKYSIKAMSERHNEIFKDII